MSVTTQQNAVDAASSTAVPPAADFGDVRAEFQALVCGSWGLRTQRPRQGFAHRQRPGALAEWHGHQQYPRSRARTRRVRFPAQSAGTYPGRFVRLQSGRVIAGRYRPVAAGENPRRLRQVHHHGRRRSGRARSWQPSESRDQSPGQPCRQRGSRCPTSRLCNLSQRPGSKLP